MAIESKMLLRIQNKSIFLYCIFLFITISSCSGRVSQDPVVFTDTQSTIKGSSPLVVSDTPTILPSLPPSLSPSATASITVPPTSTQTPSRSPTPDVYYPFTIDYLMGREYGGGVIEALETLATNSLFTRYMIKYPSDGLNIYGFLNVPVGSGPFPVVIAVHGYIDPEIYTTIDYTTRYADALARAGYLVIHPNLRNYPPSDLGKNLFRVGMAIDILNLVAIVKAQGATPGILEQADSNNIGLWGHSMGGGISTRVITVNSDIKAAVLYGAMSGDEERNFEAISQWSNGQRGNEELNVPSNQLERISPVFYFDYIQAAVSIHHGRADQLVPLRWSRETCESLMQLEKDVECFYYDDMPHTCTGEGDELFIQRTIDFFDKHLEKS
jgi:dienelactone hydrolase